LRHIFILVFKTRDAYVRYCGKTALKGTGIRELEHKKLVEK
jgi:hypothetical protein